MAKKSGRQKATDEEREAAKITKRAVNIQRHFERALSELPAESTVAKEIAWIRSHPAMSRFDRNGGKPVMLTPGDIAGAPSKAACSQLQNWVNRPDVFHAQLLTLHKKSTLTEDENDGKIDGVPPEMSRIDEMLALLDCSKPMT